MLPVSLFDSWKEGFGQVTHRLGVWIEVAYFQVVQWLHSLALTPARIFELMAYTGVSFFVGFLFKKYLRLMVYFAILCFGVLWLLQSFDLIVIDWTKIEQVLHWASNGTVSELWQNYLVLIKKHVVVLVCGVLGFIFGYRMG